MKVPPVDNSKSTPTSKNAASQVAAVKKAEFDTVMKEVMANLDELKSMSATPPDAVKKADLDQVMGEVYMALGNSTTGWRIWKLTEDKKSTYQEESYVDW